MCLCAREPWVLGQSIWCLSLHQSRGIECGVNHQKEGSCHVNVRWMLPISCVVVGVRMILASYTESVYTIPYTPEMH